MPRWPYLIRKARCRDNSFLFGKLSREFWRNKRTPTRELAHAEKKKRKTPDGQIRKTDSHSSQRPRMGSIDPRPQNIVQKEADFRNRARVAHSCSKGAGSASPTPGQWKRDVSWVLVGHADPLVEMSDQLMALLLLQFSHYHTR